MIASPNYTFGVYDGDDSAAEGSGPGPAGSARDRGRSSRTSSPPAACPPRPADFTGRSDYGPFIAAGVGIPAGGLFTGAEVPKTAADVAAVGRRRGCAVRPVLPRAVRQPVPRAQRRGRGALRRARPAVRLFGNVNLEALDINADAIATAVLTFAFDTSSIPERTAAAAARSAGPTYIGKEGSI